MSLFRAREWWSTVSGFEEFHDTGCLCLANIDNSADGSGEGARVSTPFVVWNPAHPHPF